MNIAELEANTNELHRKFEAALVQLEADVDQKEAEVESLNETVEKLGRQIYHLEDEIDRNKEDSEKIRNDEIAERDYLKTMCATSKEVRARWMLLSGQFPLTLLVIENRFSEVTTQGSNRGI